MRGRVVSDQTVFYKAVRPDGFDFHSGTIDYASAVGGDPPSPTLSHEFDSYFPGPGWLHLATVPTGCVGALWPLRLFEVEPVGEVRRDDGHPHKIGCKAVRVLREVDAHLALGPQGRAVVAHIERAGKLTEAEAADLRAEPAAWGAARYAARYAAWDAARYAAGDAARYAAGAVVVRDLITDEEYDILTGPWRDVIGDPMEGFDHD